MPPTPPGYARVAAAIYAFGVALSDPAATVLAYFASFVCDELDGRFARKFGQSSTFGAGQGACWSAHICFSQQMAGSVCFCTAQLQLTAGLAGSPLAAAPNRLATTAAPPSCSALLPCCPTLPTAQSWTW